MRADMLDSLRTTGVIIRKVGPVSICRILEKVVELVKVMAGGRDAPSKVC
jgi:hypothetical protein